MGLEGADGGGDEKRGTVAEPDDVIDEEGIVEMGREGVHARRRDSDTLIGPLIVFHSR